MRYLPLTDAERGKILQLCGVKSFEELTAQVPPDLRVQGLLDLDPGLSELELHAELGQLAYMNAGARMQSHLGQGAYDHSWPSVIDQITNRGEFLTAYTPYQPEISQGTLQSIFEFQSMVSGLLGMEVANASLYDGGCSVVEAVLMAARLLGRAQGTVWVSEGVYPHTRELLQSYCEPLNIKVETWHCDKKTLRSTAQSLGAVNPQNPIAFVMQSPNRWGLVEDWNEAAQLAKTQHSKSIAYVGHAHSLALFKSPGECGIDLAAAEGQSLGIPVGFGGPYLGLMACAKKDVRQMPGRLVGQSSDNRGQRAFCVTLSTREQHIRREKATSNICSNQNLMALRASMYMALMGPGGLKRVAELSRNNARYAREQARAALQKNNSEVQLLEGEHFNEICLLVPAKRALWAQELLAYGEKQGILMGARSEVPASSGFTQAVVAAFTERHSQAEIERWAQFVGEV